MTKPAWLNRRRFLQMTAMTALGARSKGLHAAMSSARRIQPRLAIIGAMEPAMAQPQGIHVYAIESGCWRLLQFIPSKAPVSMALHPSGESLYVLNQVSEYQGLPCGTVEAYSLQQAGHLTFLGRQPLALSATMPQHLAIAPDGTMLAVAVHGGGAYNLLPILTGGHIGRICSTVKETGCGPIAGAQDTAHPQAVIFDTTGSRLITADLGCDRLSVFSIAKQDGTLPVHSRLDLSPGSGPRHLALHPTGNLLYVDHALNASASAYRYDPVNATMGERLLHAEGQFGDALAIHPSGNFLYSAARGAMTAWRIQPDTGALQPLQTISIAAVRNIVPLPDCRAILALTSHGVLHLEIDTASGRLSSPVSVAAVAGASSIAIL